MANEVVKVLRKALTALGPNGKNWVRGDPSEALHGTFCASTALSSLGVDYDTIIGARKVLCSAAGVSDSPLEPLWNWNDAPERTWPDVEAVFKQAIANAESANA